MFLLESGTEALALAISDTFAGLRPTSVKRVALPAYACPSLVAATVWAGAEPVYYDLSRDLVPAPGAVESWLADDKTVVVHVDAMGADVAPASHPRLIRDMAQSFAPYEQGWSPSASRSIISTGRAKPLSLTRGGAVITRDGAAGRSFVPEAETSRSVLALRASLYGLSQRAVVLGALSSILGLGLGSTEFSPLAEVRRMPTGWSGSFAAAVETARRNFNTWRDETTRMVELAADSGASIPDSAFRVAGRLPLWRLPVLCPSPESASALASQAWHLGVSRLYGRTLPVIMGESPQRAAENWPGAVWVAERLVTLPTHGRLGRRQRAELGALLRSHCNPSRAASGVSSGLHRRIGDCG